MGSAADTPSREPWNKGKIVGQKAPFKVKDIWALPPFSPATVQAYQNGFMSRQHVLWNRSCEYPGQGHWTSSLVSKLDVVVINEYD